MTIENPGNNVHLWMRQIRAENRKIDMRFAYEDHQIYIKFKPLTLKYKDFHKVLEEFYDNSIEAWGEYKNGRYQPPIRHREGSGHTKIRWRS